MSHNSEFAIGIDIGGTHISGAIVNQKGIIKPKKTIRFIKPPDGKQGLRLIKQLIKGLVRLSSRSIGQLKSVAGIGIACPGSVDFDKGIVLADSPNLVGWKGTNLKKPLEGTFRLPVFIDNDANLAAWGEKTFGAGKNTKNLICLTLGTGIGGGIIINNEIYRGSHFYAGEIGHIKVLPDGPLCSCRQRGCLESLASASAIIRNYKFFTSSQWAGINSAKTVFDKARRGDKTAKEIIKRANYYLGIAIASLINIFDPQMVILCGGLAQSGNILIKKVNQIVRQNIMPHHLREPHILSGKLGPDAGLLGASALVLKNYQ
jgi:glucokinase